MAMSLFNLCLIGLNGVEGTDVVHLSHGLCAAIPSVLVSPRTNYKRLKGSGDIISDGPIPTFSSSRRYVVIAAITKRPGQQVALLRWECVALLHESRSLTVLEYGASLVPLQGR